MKRIEITAQIEAHLRSALGADADLNAFSVYEAIAFNTLPVRKRHPVYKGARADAAFLAEMADAVNKESRPVHIGHDSSGLPIGRIFHGEVVNGFSGQELRALFFIDNQHSAEIAKIEHGTVDQVSVSVLPKQLLNSVSGFDYLGAEADFTHIMTGTDPDGNTLGENGVYARMVGLDSFFEMSLVGQGGAENARIVRRDQSHFGSSFQKLAASGLDPNALVLVASVEADKMDLTALVGQLTDTKVELSTMTTAKATLEASVETLTAQNSALTQQLADLGDVPAALAAKDTEITGLTEAKTTLEADSAAAVASLQTVATALLTASGKVGEAVPATVAELSALIESTKAGLVAALVSGGRSNPSDLDSVGSHTPTADFSAFQAPRN